MAFSTLSHSGSTVLQQRFDELLKANPALSRIFDRIAALEGQIVVFGGWPRDLVASAVLERSIDPTDIDVVVTGLTRSLLYDLLPQGTRQNAFGGYVCDLETTKLDIWSIEDTYTMQRRALPFEVDLLPQTTVFTIESIIFKPAQSWKQPSIVDCGVRQSLESGLIGLAGGEIRFPAFQVGRVLQYCEKLSLELGPDAAAFVARTIAAPSGRAMITEGIRRFAHPRFRQRALHRLAAL